MFSTSLPTRVLLSAVALVLCLAAVPATADCWDDAADLYDSCIDMQFIFHGQLYTASEEACAELSGEHINACLVSMGKTNPEYIECGLQYTYYCVGYIGPVDAFTHAPDKHFCSEYMFVTRQLNCY
ncbi:MAG: hypothetical protein SX243_02255 [Acidobacteriota bacterium]|nr:hypothetical protein [Acidobacteriota bacterium]